jgi:uncharacterized protein YecE (DUF72 family)
MSQKGRFWSGTSGLVLKEPNKKAYPEAFRTKSRLEYYASQFNSIEINSSFYKIPRGVTYKNWSLGVPHEFQFTVKLWKGITHPGKGEQIRERDLEIFMEAIHALGAHKGCLLIQFPMTTTYDAGQLENLLKDLRTMDSGKDWRLAVEFRDTSWYRRQIFDLLDHFQASLVLHDMPRSKPQDFNKHAPFVYLRYHGEKGDYRGSYDSMFLSAEAKRIRKWMNEGLDVYAYFNNTMGSAASNLKTLNERVNDLSVRERSGRYTPDVSSKK